MDKSFIIKISLKDINPPIWRKLIIDPSITLFDFHKIIQTTMGWNNSHLHQFIYNNQFYCNPEYEDEWADSKFIDYRYIQLKDLIKFDNQNMIYEYDFGDGWEHFILFEEVIDEKTHYPKCIAGERCCPPDDSGGPLQYQDLLEILSNPKHKEYQESKAWIGDDFNPEFFDLDEINKMLKSEDFGCITLD